MVKHTLSFPPSFPPPHANPPTRARAFECCSLERKTKKQEKNARLKNRSTWSRGSSAINRIKPRPDLLFVFLTALFFHLPAPFVLAALSPLAWPPALRDSLIPREQLARDNVIGMLIGNSDRSRRGRVPKGATVEWRYHSFRSPTEAYSGSHPRVRTSEMDQDMGRPALDWTE